MTQQVNQQFIIDELIRRVNALTTENIVLSAQIRELQFTLQQENTENIPITAE
jgi:hypothetical protein